MQEKASKTKVPFKAQKALHVYIDQEKKKPKFNGDHPYVVFEKYDGWYGYFDFSKPEGGIKSRAGRTIPSMALHASALWSAVQRHSALTGILVFEIIIPTLDFYTTNGILNRKSDLAKEAVLMAHDYIEDYSESFESRSGKLSDVIDLVHMDFCKEAIIAGIVHNPENAYKHAQKVWDKGGEGVILKRLHAPFSPDSRNADLLKIKEEVTLDLLVVGLQEGEGKYACNVGALIVQDKGGRRHFVSGMSDAERLLWMQHPNTILDSVVEVKAMKINTDGSLREPRFKAVRHDKHANEID